MQQRAGRPIRRYAMPEPWFIPFEVTQAETLEGFISSQFLPRNEQMMRLQAAALLAEHPRWGYWLRSGTLHLGSQEGPPLRQVLADQPFLSAIGTAQLSQARALEFKRRLWALLAEFEQDEEGGESYALSVQLVRGQVR
ncbi:hypothetical protein GCM10017783_01650 [Deinococcus piscis]|uniref:Uncharacterized protein n=1 Tax=Deinococcus piscis TaxID=394230 RepID=A0ABQ3JWQ9_9DEIO|nr:hypothetical protein [Deinococcus piscis]GHF93355.1 hypothetical protein GCM10017783_01650 [Deinococcus piscis]